MGRVEPISIRLYVSPSYLACGSWRCTGPELGFCLLSEVFESRYHALLKRIFPK